MNKSGIALVAALGALATPTATVQAPIVGGAPTAAEATAQQTPQGQQNRTSSAGGFLQAMLGTGGGARYGLDKPRYLKRVHGSVARDKRVALKHRNRMRAK